MGKQTGANQLSPKLNLQLTCILFQDKISKEIVENYQLTPRDFAKNAFLGQFSLDMTQNKLQSTQKGICNMTTWLSFH